MASVEHLAAARRESELPQIFKDMKFFLAARVPSRDRYRSDIERLGGIVVSTEGDNIITIVDHLKIKTAARPNTLSYEYIDRCRTKGCLVDKTVHSIRVPQTPGLTGSGSPGDVRRGKIPFTVEEDCFLWDTVNKAIRAGTHYPAGNKLFKEIAIQRPRHTLHSWRDRWLKKIQGKPRPLPLAGAEAALQPEADKQAQTDTGDEVDEAVPPLVASPDDQLDMSVGIAPRLHETERVNEDRFWQFLSERPGLDHHTLQEWKDIWQETLKPKFQKKSRQIRSTPSESHDDNEGEAYAPGPNVELSRKEERSSELHDQPKSPNAGSKRQRLPNDAVSGREGTSGQSPRKRARRDNESDELMNEQVEATIYADDEQLVPDAETAETSETTDSTDAASHTEATDTRLTGVQDGEASDSDDPDDMPPDIDEILSSPPRTSKRVDRSTRIDHAVEAGDGKGVPGATPGDDELYEDTPASDQYKGETLNEQASGAEFDDAPATWDDLIGKTQLEDQASEVSEEADYSMESEGEELQQIPEAAYVGESIGSSTHEGYEDEEDERSEPDIDGLAAVASEGLEHTLQADETADLTDDDTRFIDDEDEVEAEIEAETVHAVLPRDTQMAFEEPLPEFDLEMPEPDSEGDDATSDQLMAEVPPTSSNITTTTPGNTASQTQVSSAPSRHRHSSVEDGSYIETTQPGMTPRVLGNSSHAEAPMQSSIAESDSEAGPTGDNDLPRWVAEKQREGYGGQQIGHALRASCLQLDVADLALRFIGAKNRLPDNMRGLWTEKDDRDLQSSDARKVMRVQEKHGDHNLQVRVEFLNEESEDS